jgi:large subunit ribosomal protein L15
MNLNAVTSISLGHKKRKRVGRGFGCHGNESGRGGKGQTKGKGFSMRPQFEGGPTPVFKRFPKRGFSNVNFATRYSVINVGDLNELSDVSEFTPEVLLAKRVIRKMEKDGLKVLGDGEVTRAITVKAAKFSKSAVEKIQAAGGKAEVI